MRSDYYMGLPSEEFSRLIVSEHIHIAEKNEEQAERCEMGKLRRDHLETAAFHRLLARRLKLQMEKW